MIKSKAPVTTAEYGDRYTLIGPLNRASVRRGLNVFFSRTPVDLIQTGCRRSRAPHSHKPRARRNYSEYAGKRYWLGLWPMADRGRSKNTAH